MADPPTIFATTPSEPTSDRSLLDVSPELQEVFLYLASMPVDEAVSDRSRLMVTVAPSATLADAVKLMSENNVLSLPVIERGADGAKVPKGFVDMLDVVCFIAESAPRGEGNAGQTTRNPRELFAYASVLHQTQVADVIDLSGRNPFVDLTAEDGMVAVLSCMQLGVHRVGLVNADGELQNTISQTDVVRHLWDVIKPDGPVPAAGVKKLAELGIAQDGVDCVDENATMLEAAQLLRTRRYAGLPVVSSDNGRLVGNLSISDFRGLAQEAFPSLNLSVKSYLFKQSQGSLSPICLTQDVSLYTAVNTLVENKIHRVWVIDSGFKPVGVVSLSDVLMSVGNPEVLEAISGMSAACAILQAEVFPLGRHWGMCSVVGLGPGGTHRVVLRDSLQAIVRENV